MKVLSLGLVLLSLCAVGSSAGEEKEKYSINYNMDYLDKTWGIKFKSARVIEERNEITMLLEFSKDVTELKEMRKTLSPAVDAKGVLIPPVQLWFYCFDEENVVLSKAIIMRLEGELTGKKGDNFRISIGVSLTTKIKKLEARPKETDSKGENKDNKGG